MGLINIVRPTNAHTTFQILIYTHTIISQIQNAVWAAPMHRSVISSFFFLCPRCLTHNHLIVVRLCASSSTHTQNAHSFMVFINHYMCFFFLSSPIFTSYFSSIPERESAKSAAAQESIRLNRQSMMLVSIR